LYGHANIVVAIGGGPTAVANDCLLGVVEEARQVDKVDNLLGAVHGIKGILKGDLPEVSVGIDGRFSGFGPGAFLGSCRYSMQNGDYYKILEVFRMKGIRYAIFMGGEGTMSMLSKLKGYARKTRTDLALIGVPMTVDNDITATDHCLGYGSAARFYATSVMEVGIDAKSLPPPVTVFETMGRDSGWLAASTILARETEEDPPHLVLLPECPFDKELFLERVHSIHRDLGYVLVVVSEGLKEPKARSLSMGEDANRDEFGHPLYGGVGRYLCHLVSSRLGLRARDEKPGLLARCCMSLISRTDQNEAHRLGEEAVRYAVQRGTSGMLALKRKNQNIYACETELIPFPNKGDGTRLVPDHFISGEKGQISKDFLDYLKPLIGDPIPRYRSLEEFPAG